MKNDTNQIIETMKTLPSLIPGKYYHIYNCGIQKSELFRESKHYAHFLMLYERHIDPIADTFAWCLMNNHFHFLVRIRVHDVNPVATPGVIANQEDNTSVRRTASQSFSNLFNAYAQHFNYSVERSGVLFHRPFKRIEVDSPAYFKQLVYYIHNNPVKHGFTDRMGDYPWSSYLSVLSIKPTRLKRDELIGWFDDKGDFFNYHNQSQNLNAIQMFWLEI
jgi:REP element-mobilizing transposase RayT